MQSKLITISDLTERDIGAWRDLARQAVEPNPFHEPEFLLPLTRAQNLSDRVSLLVVSSAARWHAALPVQLGPWRRIPLRSMHTSRGLYSFLGSPLAGPDRLETVLGALVEGLQGLAQSRFVALDWIGDDGPISTPMHEVLDAHGERAAVFERFSRAVMRRGEEPIASPLSSKRRSELRRNRRRLGEALGEEVEVVDRSSEEAAYDTFLDLEASGWKGEGKTAMRARPADAQFFRTMCREFSEQGRLRLLVLQTGTQPIAAQCDLRAGDAMFGFKIGYGAEWSQYSPGMQLLFEATERFRGDDELRLLDSCADPGNPIANRLFPDRRALASYTIRGPGAGGSIAGAALSLAKSLRERKSTLGKG